MLKCRQLSSITAVKMVSHQNRRTHLGNSKTIIYMQVQRSIVTMPMSNRPLCYPHISIIGKVLNCMTAIKIYYSCLCTDTNNKSTQKSRLSETMLLSAQSQIYKQVDSDFFFKYHDVFRNAHLKYRMLLQCHQLSSVTATFTGTTDAI